MVVAAQHANVRPRPARPGPICPSAVALHVGAAVLLVLLFNFVINSSRDTTMKALWASKIPSRSMRGKGRGWPILMDSILTGTKRIVTLIMHSHRPFESNVSC